MTVATSGGGEVSAYTPDDLDNLGLEDVGVSDVIIPRLQIQHADGTFKDNLSGAVYSELNVILLGLVKQRIMWADDVEDNQKPQCKSPDHVHGFPNVHPKAGPDERFPWEDSNFSPDQAKPLVIPPGTDKLFPEGWNSNGHGQLPCASCAFAEWGQDRNGKSVPPKCTEQHTFPLMYSPDGESWVTALLTLQRTGIKPSRQYISSFAQRKTPMFTVLTKINLRQESRGSVKYSVPIFSQVGATDRSMWSQYGDTLRSVRSFIRQAPRPTEDDEPVESDNTNTAPAPAPAAAAAAPAAPAPAAPAPAPAAAAPAPAAVAAPAAAPPVAAPAAAVPAVAAADDDDDLPF